MSDEENRKARIIARIQKMSPAKLAALEALFDAFEATETETTKRPKRPASLPSDAPRLVTAAELFGDTSPTQRAKPRQRYKFPEELLADPDAFKRAESIANARRHKITKKLAITPEEDTRGKMADAFVHQAKRRRAAAANI